MSAYIDKLKAERAQRLDRMQVPPDSCAGRGLAPVGVPEWAYSLWRDEMIDFDSRLEALERKVAALVDPPPAVVPQAQIRISDIQDVVSRRFGLTVADLQGRSRRGPISDARHVAMYLAQRLTGKSFIAIARQFGGRRHAGVFKAWQNIDRLRGHDTELDAELQALAARLHERARSGVANE